MFSKFMKWESEGKIKFGWLKKYLRRIPELKFFRHFNFILLHYIYILFWTILGSVLLYSVGGLRYIDALFFASGAATQSGLNTVNVNDIYLYQQIVLILIACIANPIWINSMVVFIRLYWFEKRFQTVVRDAKMWRRTRTRSRTKSEAKRDIEDVPGATQELSGVRGREIRVLRNPNGKADSAPWPKEKESDSDSQHHDLVKTNEAAVGSEAGSSETQGDVEVPSPPPKPRERSFTQDIMWADDVKPPRLAGMDGVERLPQSRTREESIAFIENQRKGEKAKLRVPGPRDMERGEVPHQVDEDDEDAMSRVLTREDSPELHRERPRKSEDSRDTDHRGDTQSDGFGHIGSWRPKMPSLWPHRSTGNAEAPDDTSFRRRGRTLTFASFRTGGRTEERDPMPYLSYAPTVGRNSMFIDLTEEQREELGGVEYRALKTLAWILSIYYLGFHVLGIICLVPWILHTSYKKVPESDGQSATWWGIFTPMSLFTDLGFTLTPDSMISFQYALFPLLLGSFLIVIGNTGFPCMLRFSIWIFRCFIPYGTPLYEELSFLLDHPRRCFTLLFPKQATWWLFAILVILNGIDIIFFIILDLHDPTITVLPPGIRFVDGCFQAFSTRTAGFAVVNLADLHPAIQVSYLIMMYISIYPIAISIRRTNVYEEKSLGIYTTPTQDEKAGQSYVGAHLRRQLSFDLWFVFLGLFIICIVEGSQIESTNEYAFTIFAVLFEIVSAYGTVGLSLGYPNSDASFSAQFHTLSKLVIIAMQIRGRHRGLPYALDRAILLPSESLQRKEAEAAARARRPRQPSNAVAGVPPDDVLRSQTADVTRATGVSRRYSTGNMGFSEGRTSVFVHHPIVAVNRQGTGLRRIVSGALSAGPSRRRTGRKEA